MMRGSSDQAKKETRRIEPQKMEPRGEEALKRGSPEKGCQKRESHEDVNTKRRSLKNRCTEEGLLKRAVNEERKLREKKLRRNPVGEVLESGIAEERAPGRGNPKKSPKLAGT